MWSTLLGSLDATELICVTIRHMVRQIAATLALSASLLLNRPGLANGLAEVAHGGTTADYIAWLGSLPARDVSIAVTCNAGSANRLEIGHQLADSCRFESL